MVGNTNRISLLAFMVMLLKHLKVSNIVLILVGFLVQISLKFVLSPDIRNSKISPWTRANHPVLELFRSN